MITNYAASGMGQFLLPLADPESFYLFTVVSIIFSISIVPILLTQSQAPIPPKRSRVDLRALYRLSPVGMLGASTAGFINSGFLHAGAGLCHLQRVFHCPDIHLHVHRNIQRPAAAVAPRKNFRPD